MVADQTQLGNGSEGDYAHILDEQDGVSHSGVDLAVLRRFDAKWEAEGVMRACVHLRRDVQCMLPMQ